MASPGIGVPDRFSGLVDGGGPRRYPAFICLIFVLGTLLCACGKDDDIRWQSLTDEALSMYRGRQFGKALVKAEEAIRLARNAYGEDNDKVALSLGYLARIQQARGETIQAELNFKKSLKILTGNHPEPHPDLAQLESRFADFLASEKRYSEAEGHYLKAIDLNKKILGPKHRNVGILYDTLGNLYLAEGEAGKAAEAFTEALAIVRKTEGPHSPNQVFVMKRLALAKARLGLFEDGERLLRQAVELIEKTKGKNVPLVAMLAETLGGLYESEGKLDAAISQMERSLSIAELTLGPKDPRLVKPLSSLSRLLSKAGRTDEAERLRKRASKLLRKKSRPTGPTKSPGGVTNPGKEAASQASGTSSSTSCPAVPVSTNAQ